LLKRQLTHLFTQNSPKKKKKKITWALTQSMKVWEENLKTMKEINNLIWATSVWKSYTRTAVIKNRETKIRMISFIKKAITTRWIKNIKWMNKLNHSFCLQNNNLKKIKLMRRLGLSSKFGTKTRTVLKHYTFWAFAI
jgi:hypothetical protein